MSTAKNPGNMTLNMRTLQLGGPKGWVDVSNADCLLLKALAASSDHRLDTASLLQSTGKSTDLVGKHALEVQIVRLRKKLASAGAVSPIIKAIRGVGYQLCVHLQVECQQS